MSTTDLKVKRLSDILAELVDYTSMHTDQITDFTEGSVIRSIYEAIGMTQEQLYQLSTENVTWAIDHGILDAFDFTPKEALHAYGEVTIDLANPTVKDIVLAKGTTFYSTPLGNQTQFFQTQEAYLVPQGTTSFIVEVYCTEAGDIGNIPAFYIDSVTTTQFSVLSVGNEDAFLTGRDEETAEELKKRFREFVATRGRATKRSIEYAVNSVPEVVGSFITEGAGYFDVYIHDANGNLPQELDNKARLAIEDYRPAGIQWDTHGLQKVRVSLDINIAVTNRDLVSDTFIDSLTLYVSDYLNHFKADDDLVANVLAEKIISYSSLIADVQFVGGATYTTDTAEIIRAGDISINISDKPNFNGKNEIPVDAIDDDDTSDTGDTKPVDTDGGKKLFGFVYYNSSYNYDRNSNSSTPISITYYDKQHIIITTLPYDLDIDETMPRLRVENNTYTLLDEYAIPIKSIHYDNNGSVYTTYDTKGVITSQIEYDNYGRKTVIE